MITAPAVLPTVRGRPPLAILMAIVPAALVLLGVVAPVVYLIVRAAQAEPAEALDILWRGRHAWLFLNTLTLAAGVLVASTAIALPLAWLTTRTNLPGRRAIVILSILPLAMPGYVVAYGLLGATGPTGMLANWTGIVVPRLSGYTGALIALSVYLFPYLFLNLRAAFRGIDPSLEETARSVGSSAWGTFFRVTLPQLRPAFQSGALLVGLHVLGDFGVVSLMRYETFSYALYILYSTSYDRVYVSWLALLLMALAAAILLVEARFLRGVRLHRAGSGHSRRHAAVRLGWWAVPSYGLIAFVTLAAWVVPLVAVVFWCFRGDTAEWVEVRSALFSSLAASIPAAILAPLITLPIVYLSLRRPSRATGAMERVAYFGYATPPLAFGLAMVSFAAPLEVWLQGWFPWLPTPVLYGTLTMLVLAYTIHFVAEAVGPIRSALYQAPPRLTESARALGCGSVAGFCRVTLPIIRPGLLAAMTLVFLSAVKELPLTLMLAPLDFRTLAIEVWDSTREARFAEAAPYALGIVALSAGFVGVLLTAGEAGEP